MLKILAAVLAVFLAFAVPAASMAQQAQNPADIVFNEVQKRIIKDYFGGGDGDDDDRDGKGKGARGKGKPKGLPPGLAKKDSLPPGLQKQIERNGTLPPGLARRDLPDDLLARIGPFPDGVEPKVVGSDVVLIRKGTEVVLDVLQDVIAGAGR